MREYTVAIEPGEVSGYVASCASVNAMSQGATVDEAMAHITEAIELILEDMAASGEAIPVDRGAETHTIRIAV
ncbi:MAG: HicB like antitoxin of bacterial toxin-antitoxin system [Thermoleophilia bacterium]|nr:HicB like antitoxin of bacterial toxin-antitoxin system [Thermoleophilia bacterium]